MAPKFPIFHNGRKIRGKAVGIPDPPKRNKGTRDDIKMDNDDDETKEHFIIKEFTKKDYFLIENLKAVYKNTKKTLRLVVSLSSQPYDILVILAPFLAQLRHTVSIAMKQTTGLWETEVSQELWHFFCLQLLELHKCCLYEYPRIPAGATSEDKSCDLLVLSDASISQMICAFLIYRTSNGKAASLLFARSYLSNSTTTVPMLEMQAISLAASILYKIISELGSLINKAYLCSDSLVSCHWVNTDVDQLSIFVENRVLNV